MENKPYYTQEFNIKSLEIYDGEHYYCTSCKSYHNKYDKPIFYRTQVAGVSIPAFRSCDKTYIDNITELYNIGHENMKNLSLSQGHKEILI